MNGIVLRPTVNESSCKHYLFENRHNSTKRKSERQLTLSKICQRSPLKIPAAQTPASTGEVTHVKAGNFVNLSKSYRLPILRKFPQIIGWTPREKKANPIVAPTIEWVVDTGILNIVASNIHILHPIKMAIWPFSSSSTTAVSLSKVMLAGLKTSKSTTPRLKVSVTWCPEQEIKGGKLAIRHLTQHTRSENLKDAGQNVYMKKSKSLKVRW